MAGDTVSPNEKRTTVIVGLGLAAFALPILPRLFAEWRINDNYNHGAFVLPLGVLILYRALVRETQDIPAHGGRVSGFAALFPAALTYYAGVRLNETTLSAFGVWLAVVAAVLIFCGPEKRKNALFPLFLLLFAVPIPGVLASRVLHQPLQRFAVVAASGILAALGVPVSTWGNVIFVRRIDINVTEACSGLKGMLAVSYLALLLGYMIIHERRTARLMLLIFSWPIATFANVCRLVLAGFFTERFGRDTADAFLHGYSVYFVYAVDIALLILLASAMSEPEESYRGGWKGDA